jgi:transcriptional regulator with PAS, ATPase and Fis domain
LRLRQVIATYKSFIYETHEKSIAYFLCIWYNMFKYETHFEVIMKNYIRVLGIAPYEGMKIQMMNLAKDFPQIDLTVYVGDMEQGLTIAQNNFHGDYDVVISRGATAQILRQKLTIPVIEIEISMYDILCAIKLANGLKKKITMISFADIKNHVLPLCDLLECDIDIHTLDSIEAVEPTLRSLQEKQCETILCDVIVNTTAQRLGINSFLITSGIDSIRNAYNQTLLLCDSQQYLRDENLFFRELLRGQIGQTIVFDSQGNLFLSTLEDLKPDLLDLLRHELNQVGQDGDQRISRSLRGMRYSIRVRQITSGTLRYTAFFFDERKLPVASNQIGISFSGRAEAEAAYYSSIFSFVGNLQGSQQEIDQISQSTAPVIFTGEDGTGKESIVSMLYIKGQLRNNPLVSINCSLLNDRSWAFLMEHHNSPLADEGSTLYFANVDVLSLERQYQLIAVLTEMDVCQRNRVMISCVCQSGEYISKVGALFREKLSCLSLYLPPLRQVSHQIPTLMNLCLSHMNVNMPKQILGADPEALALLQRYNWPHNYTQFRRVIEELAVTGTSHIITAENVRQVLLKERHVGAFSSQKENAATPLDLNRTLSEISKDIAIRVVDETEGNHTAAAKRLGISRTTLWRLLQDNT